MVFNDQFRQQLWVEVDLDNAAILVCGGRGRERKEREIEDPRNYFDQILHVCSFTRSTNSGSLLSAYLKNSKNGRHRAN